MIEHQGPQYDIDSATLKKFRSKARKGLVALSPTEREAYSAVVRAAVLSKQRSEFIRSSYDSVPRPNCASRTYHSTGEAISKAIQQQHRSALQSHVAAVRRNRTPEQWRAMYAEAMAYKQRNQQPRKQKQ